MFLATHSKVFYKGSSRMVAKDERYSDTAETDSRMSFRMDVVAAGVDDDDDSHCISGKVVVNPYGVSQEKSRSDK